MKSKQLQQKCIKSNNAYQSFVDFRNADFRMTSTRQPYLLSTNVACGALWWIGRKLQRNRTLALWPQDEAFYLFYWRHPHCPAL